MNFDAFCCGFPMNFDTFCAKVITFTFEHPETAPYEFFMCSNAIEGFIVLSTGRGCGIVGFAQTQLVPSWC